MKTCRLVIPFLLLTYCLHGDSQKGQKVYNTYCASCHGPEGAGLVGPNLTDQEIVHGNTRKDIIRVITDGVPGKAMPAWGSILTPPQIADLADFVQSIMGQNLPSPFKQGRSSVTPFPQGSRSRPLLMRTFMPSMGLGDEVLAHHAKGLPAPKYNATSGKENPRRMDKPINGLPGTIAVNFGPQLSYCFDSTECRLLYTWHGDFMDMTSYWGAGTGGDRKKFAYIGQLLGQTTFRAAGKAPLPGRPQFKGYRKVQSIPEFMYSLGHINFTLRVVPGKEAGDALCHYTSDATDGLTLKFSPEEAPQLSVDKGQFKNGVLKLNPSEAASFTISIKGVTP